MNLILQWCLEIFALDPENISRYLQEIRLECTYKNQRQSRDQKGRLGSKLLNFRLIVQSSFCVEVRSNVFQIWERVWDSALLFVTRTWVSHFISRGDISSCTTSLKERMNYCGYQIQLQAIKPTFTVSYCYNQASFLLEKPFRKTYF